MRGSVLGSSLVHMTALAVLFVIRQSAPIIVPGPDVVQVALVDPQSAALPSVTPPTPRVVERIPDVAPTEDEGVQIQPPKPPKQKKPEPAPEPPRPAPDRPAAALPYAPVGAVGLRGEVSVDAADFEFTYYLMLVRNRVAQNWTPPAGIAVGSGLEAVVYFRISRNGSITAPRIETASPIDFFNRSALRAVVLSDPLPPLPLGYPGADLGVHFGFNFTGP